MIQLLNAFNAVSEDELPCWSMFRGRELDRKPSQQSTHQSQPKQRMKSFEEVFHCPCVRKQRSIKLTQYKTAHEATTQSSVEDSSLLTRPPWTNPYLVVACGQVEMAGGSMGSRV